MQCLFKHNLIFTGEEDAVSLAFRGAELGEIINFGDLNDQDRY